MKRHFIKKLIGRIHLWLGLTSGLVVFIVSITGCLYAFVDELKPVLYHEWMEISVPENDAKRLPLSKIVEYASAELPNAPLYMIIPNQPKATVEIQSWGENPDAWTYFGQFPSWETVYMNPYNGQIIKHIYNVQEFFSLVLVSHFSLLLDYNTGTLIVGISTLIFVIMLITGLILWWPKNKNATKQRLLFRWKSTTKWRRKNYDLHNISGFYMMIFALLIALTGLVWAFDWMDKGVQWIANGGQTYINKNDSINNTDQNLPNGHDLNQLYE